MNLKLKKDTLEHLLISNWTNILDVREVIKLVTDVMSNKTNCQYKFDKLIISRFEPQDDCFLIWIETICKDTKINYTIECFYNLNGSLKINSVF
jgi:hypothetical protein